MTKRLWLVALVVALLGPLYTTTATADPAPEPTPRAEPTLRWQRCSPEQPARLRCATLRVPVDHANPAGRSIAIRISRLPATNPAKRRGVLLLNPGGPGNPGLNMPLESPLPKAVTERYDLIGFDPRGVGASTPLGCGTDGSFVLPIPFEADRFGDAVRESRSQAQRCRAAHRDLLPYITTRNTARDMDLIRAALGERKISFYGISYGTYLGTVYSQLFRRNVDRIVLDSNVDPDRTWRNMVRIWAVAAERGFDHFARWAAGRDPTYHLGDTPLQVDVRFRRLLRELDREPVTVDGISYEGNTVRSAAAGVGQSDPVNRGFADLLRALEGKQGRGQVAALRTESHPVRWQLPPVDNTTASFLAVVCGDARWPRDPEVYRRDAIRDSQRFPVRGGETSNITPCAFWPEPRERRTEIADNDTPALLVQNDLDTATPIEGARNLRRLLPDSRLALVSGSWEHGAYGGDCADATVTRYLTTGTLPQEDVTCRSRGADS